MPVTPAGGRERASAGDPVSYSDPFGLKPCSILPWSKSFCTWSDIKENYHQWAGIHNSVSDVRNALRPFAKAANPAMLEGAGALGAATAKSVSVVHFTSAEGAAAIEESGALRGGSFVTIPGEVGGMSALQVEGALEISAGRGAMSFEFRIGIDELKGADNGPLTSGGSVQFQTTQPVPIAPGSFTPTPQ